MIIGSNFKLSNRKFLDDRQQYEGLSELNLNEKGYLFPLGFEVYCVREGKWYQNVSTDKNVPLWEERKGNGNLDIDDVIADGEVLSNKTWSSEYIDSFKTNIETLIIDNEDYIAEIEDRVLFIEGQFHWLESFDGSYNSLTDKPTIPTRTSELINDAGFAPYSELDSSGVFQLKHYHDNKDLLDTITEERVAQWDSNSENSFGGVYNYLDNKPLTYLGDDSDIVINFANVNSGNYMVNGIIGDYALANELTFIEKTDEQIIVTLPRMSKKITFELVDGIWTKINEVNYQVDKDNANISNSLNIGTDNIVGENNQIVQGKYNVEDTEGKYINIVGNGEDKNNRKNIHTLDWEGNAWYNGKVSQEGVPTEDKDLVTKGYVDGKFATSERVEKYIEDNDKENARRDVIIDALANGRRRTIDYVDGEADLFYATEKDDIFIDKIEGETLVNVCDQEEPIAITKSYTVENTNHVALQGEYDGKCRPVVHGNTLVNRNVEYDKSMVIGQNINVSGTEIKLEGMKNGEIQISLDGHTAINLGTKKGGGLRKSFDNAVGNEISLMANENSRIDVIAEGNTIYYNNDTDEYLTEFTENSNLSLLSTFEDKLIPYSVMTDEYESVSETQYKCDITIKPNTTYTIVTSFNMDKYQYAVYTQDELISYIDYSETVAVRTFSSEVSTIRIKTRLYPLYEGEDYSFTLDEVLGGMLIVEGDWTGRESLLVDEYFGKYKVDMRSVDVNSNILTAKTIYLNSPLYKGDRIEMYNGKLCYYHKMDSMVLDGENWGLSDSNYENTIVFSTIINGKDNVVCDKFPKKYNEDDIEKIVLNSDGGLYIHISKSKLSTTDINGFKQWLSENPTTVIYELSSPYYEEISTTEDMIFDIATSSTLTYESNIPMGNSTFLPYVDELNLLESFTQYTVSFDCDVEGLSLTVSLGGTSTMITSELRNTVSIITPPIETDGKLMIDGYGIANIDNVVVTKGEMVYEYFEGLKSSFEDEWNSEKYKVKLTLTTNNNNLIFGKGGRL